MLNKKVKYCIDKKGRETAKFNSMIFIKEDSGYYRISNNWNENIPNSYRLHKAVYEYYYGKVPEGYNVHHIDSNKDNNDKKNLEAITTKDHSVIHMTLERKEKSRVNFNKAKEKAAIWHKTNPLSHDIHSKASKEGWSRRTTYSHICTQCGKEFKTREKECKFCNGKCKNDYSLGYSLLDIVNIEEIGRHDVYNMEVKRHHNYAIDGGIIIHNCDAIRYYINTILKIRILRGLR